jgi:hypothetical protein
MNFTGTEFSVESFCVGGKIKNRLLCRRDQERVPAPDAVNRASRLAGTLEYILWLANFACLRVRREANSARAGALTFLDGLFAPGTISTNQNPITLEI